MTVRHETRALPRTRPEAVGTVDDVRSMEQRVTELESWAFQTRSLEKALNDLPHRVRTECQDYLGPMFELCLNRMATKEDLHAVRTELKGDIQSVRDELKSDIATVRDELKSDITTVRDELKGDIQSVRTELKSDITTVRDELKGDIISLDQKLDRILAKLGD
ncbi:hypothetical protein [Nonomuraea sp. NPDC046570]|uniref:hypothetical protein n=1 Tax=Nonomuraea sp. NPDC046570 TaxID=3155255 RepID=UPI0033D19660